MQRVDLNFRALILFDIDGVIRDVSGSYHLALKRTVYKFCNWLPTSQDIDSLKAEGLWNNDWDASHELIKRHVQQNNLPNKIPPKEDLIKSFSDFYFGGDPDGDPKNWEGLIKNEPLLIDKNFFEQLSNQNICWGFVSGAEPPSARYVLTNRLDLKEPPLLAMGDVPDKPDPTGLLNLSSKLLDSNLGEKTPPIAYVGDTVADVLTVQRARKVSPFQRFVSIAVAPPHLHKPKESSNRLVYEKQLKKAGADLILKRTKDLIQFLPKDW